jgi:uncharacterized iron-regulated protein
MNIRFIIVMIGVLCSIPLTSSAQKNSKKAKQTQANIIASNPTPYLIYTSEGEMTSFQNIVEAALEADVVLFGELHDNPMIHWIQLLLTESLDVEGKELVLGAEMFETDDQLPLNEYLNGVINLSKLEVNTRVWPNFQTDYLPLVDYAKDNKCRFIATNVPRRYASFVYYHGLDTLEYLSDEAKKLLPPLPISYDSSVGCYVEMLEMSGGHGGENLPKSQALKDACMAHNISVNLPENGVFIHYNGAFHSQNKDGIAWYLRQTNPELKVLTIDATEQDDISIFDEERLGVADFIIVTPSNLTKTH